MDNKETPVAHDESMTEKILNSDIGSVLHQPEHAASENEETSSEVSSEEDGAGTEGNSAVSIKVTPDMLREVLHRKQMMLMQSSEVVHFLRQQQLKAWGNVENEPPLSSTEHLANSPSNSKDSSSVSKDVTNDRKPPR